MNINEALLFCKVYNEGFFLY